MKKIMLISILLAFSVLAYSQEVQGIWETQIQIFESFDGSIDTALDRLPDEAIFSIQFDEEFGNMLFRSGRESRFLWHAYIGMESLCLNYLTEKQGILFASAEDVWVDHSFINEEMLLLRFAFRSAEVPTSHFIFILKRIPSE